MDEGGHEEGERLASSRLGDADEVLAREQVGPRLRLDRRWALEALKQDFKENYRLELSFVVIMLRIRVTKTVFDLFYSLFLDRFHDVRVWLEAVAELRRRVQQRRLALLVEVGDGDVVVLPPEGVDVLLRHGRHFGVLHVKLLDQVRQLGPPDLLVGLVLRVQGVPVDGLVVVDVRRHDGVEKES